MAIRFGCPSCKQPIEVDDEWGGQSVTCPYCRKVVTAPQSSSWPPQDVPTATPARSAFAPPPPPVPHGEDPRHHWQEPTGASKQASGSSTAGWALTLSFASAILCIIGFFIWVGSFFAVVVNEIGMDASQQQMQQEMQRIMSEGKFKNPPAGYITVGVGTVCGVISIILAITALVRSEPRKGFAIAALLISGCFVVCQLILSMTMLQSARGFPANAPTDTAPVTEKSIE